MDPNAVLHRLRQGMARLREGPPKRSSLDKLRMRGVRWIPEVDGIKTAAEGAGFHIDDAFSGSRMFTPRVVLIIDTGEQDDAVVGLLHALIEQGLTSANDVLLVAGERGVVDYKRTEAFVAITFDAAMALNEKRDRAQVKEILRSAQSSLDEDKLLAGIELAVGQNLMLLVLRAGDEERYPLVAPGHFLYRLYPELESAGIPIEFDDDVPAVREALDRAKQEIARGAFWTDTNADADALAEYFALVVRRVDEHFAPTILQSASAGRVYQILGLSDFLAGNLTTALQDNGVPSLVLAPRTLPDHPTNGFHVTVHACANEGLAATESVPEPTAADAEEPTLSALEPLVEGAPSTEEFADDPARVDPPAAAPEAPAAQPPVSAAPPTSTWGKEPAPKGGLKFKRVKVPGAPDAPPPPPPLRPEPAPPPPPIIEAPAPPPPPPPVFSLPPPPPSATSDKRDATRVDEGGPPTYRPETPLPPVKPEPPPARPAPPKPDPSPPRAAPPPPPTPRPAPPPPVKAEPPPTPRPAPPPPVKAEPPPPPSPAKVEPPRTVPAAQAEPAPPPRAEPRAAPQPAARTEVGPSSETGGGMSFLDEMIYESARGYVRAAQDESLRRPIAVRLCAAGTGKAGRDSLVARAHLLERARGPGVPVVLGMPHSADGEVGLAMPRFRGDSLWRIRKRAKDALQAPFVQFSARPFRRAAESLLFAIARAHAAGVVHGGINPARILWGGEDGLTLLGWGCAGESGAPMRIDRSLYPETAPEGEPVLINPAGWPGAVGFTAPEWLAGSRAKFAPTADVYAAAATLWFLWTGSLPGTDGEEPPPGLAQVLRRALDMDAANRPADGGRLFRQVIAQLDA